MLKQAVVLLWGIGRARCGETRLTSWAGTSESLTPLLEIHRRSGERQAGRPDYPIAALYRAGLWELRGHDGAVPTAHGDAELKDWFAENEPESGLSLPVYELMRYSPEARSKVVSAIGSKFSIDFEGTTLLSAVGLVDR